MDGPNERDELPTMKMTIGGMTKEEAHEIVESMAKMSARLCAVEYLLVQRGLFSVEELDETTATCMAEVEKKINEVIQKMAGYHQAQ